MRLVSMWSKLECLLEATRSEAMLPCQGTEEGAGLGDKGPQIMGLVQHVELLQMDEPGITWQVLTAGSNVRTDFQLQF